MLQKFGLYILAIVLCILFVRIKALGLRTNNSALILNDKDSIKISLFPESERPIKVSDADKPILRYGFHRTHDCNNFEKAFICVRKCIDLDYQIAHSDKDCACTCYRNTILAKYKPPITGPKKWKLGAPTTSLPPWAGKGEPKPYDYEINANYTEFIEQPTTESQNYGGGEHVEEHAIDEHHGAADSEHPAAAGDAPAEAPPAEGEVPAEDNAPHEEDKATVEGEPAAEEAAAEAPHEGEAAAEAPAEGDPPAEEAPAE